MSDELQKLLTQEEVMERLQISRVTLYRLRKAGLPAVRVGGAIRFDLTAVKTWLGSQEQEPTPTAWDWSVWSWVPAERRPNGTAEPPFWYEECRCRNEADAQSIHSALRQAHPPTHYRVGRTKPESAPGEAQS